MKETKQGDFKKFILRKKLKNSFDCVQPVMASGNAEHVTISHIVAMPYPGRGHINPLMNFCKLLASKSDNIIVTFVITEEWFGFIGSDPQPAKFHFRTIPNVVPSELNRGADISGFVEAVVTKMEAPFEQLLDQLDPPATTIIHDSFLFWTIDVGKRRNIPVTTFWPMSATVFSFFHHFDLLLQNHHFPTNSSEKGGEMIEYIPGVSTTRVADLPSAFRGSNIPLLRRILEAISVISNANYLILSTVSELESQVIDALKMTIKIPILSTGPCIPYSQLKESSSLNNNTENEANYLQWLDEQPSQSVLYISMGSLLSFSSTQMDEIAAGLRISGVRYLWVARGETSRLKDECGEKGLVVPWCDQLRVLTHSSVGGFWSHCGWNSTMEGVFAGVPFLTFPVIIDQLTNSKMIVEDWKVGWRVNEKDVGENVLAERDEIAELIQWFMDLESGRGIKLRRRARELQEMCQQATSEGGSSRANIETFFRAILPWN